MGGCYENTCHSTFERDLREKDWVILLESDGAIRGFSTVLFFDHPTPSGPVRVVFSGDTVIDPACWGTEALPRAWIRLVMSPANGAGDAPFYWFLICKGYKTYRYLPLFVNEFYPRFDARTPPATRALIDSLATRRFGARYDVASGVVLAGTDHDRLKPGVADITPRQRKNPHVAFFERANPGHVQGDEIVCLARLDGGNVKPFLLRSLEAP